jgi:GNAT superfamily N-acetyltransferase
MIQIKRLSECSLEEGVKAWNVGFEGYFFDATTTVENFVNRLVLEGLSPRLSVVAFHDNEPIGIVKNGIRVFNGKKLAWNGGTGVAKDFRKHGVGRALMEETFNIFREDGVEHATLEAISDNQKAISLYEKLGYQTVDDLEYLALNGLLAKELTPASTDYIAERVATQLVSYLPFYKGQNPWQTQWQSAKDSEGLIVKDKDGAEIGYAYFRKAYDSDGKHEKTILFQCESNPERSDGEKIISYMLGEIFGTFNDSIQRIIPNLPVNGSSMTYSILKSIGFEPIAKQVFMLKELQK